MSRTKVPKSKKARVSIHLIVHMADWRFLLFAKVEQTLNLTSSRLVTHRMIFSQQCSSWLQSADTVHGAEPTAMVMATARMNVTARIAIWIERQNLVSVKHASTTSAKSRGDDGHGKGEHRCLYRRLCSLLVL